MAQTRQRDGTPSVQTLKRLMKEKGWNQAKLARAAGYTDHSYVSRVLREEERLTDATYQRLRAALDEDAPPTKALSEVHDRLEALANQVAAGFEELGGILDERLPAPDAQSRRASQHRTRPRK